MEIKKLNTTITHIDKIFHISDIHIRTLKRHKEYTEVFENLFLDNYKKIINDYTYLSKRWKNNYR